MIRHTILLLAALCLTLTTAQGQTDTTFAQKPKSQWLKHLDLSLTAGTTGIGFDLAAPLSDVVQLRAGFSAMPHIDVNMHFGVQVGRQREGESYEQFMERSNSNFNRLAGMLTGFTGYEVDDEVVMTGNPTYYNAKLLVDVKPFSNKHWHFTAGFYYGNADAGRAFNTREDMATLMAVGIYNNMYESSTATLTRIRQDAAANPDYYLDTPLGQMLGDDLPILNVLGLTASDNSMLNSIYVDPNDPESNFLLRTLKRFEDYGRMGIRIGDYKRDIVDADGNIIHKKGDPYVMEPDKNSMVKAWAKVNRFKPYLGFGYGGRLIKGNDNWAISFDAGLLFWGGAPDIVTHDGTDLVNDVENVRGRVGDYVDVIKKFKAFPVIDLRITRRIF